MCDSGKGETFCERSKKEQSARKISRCARNDGMVYSVLCETAENGETFCERSKKEQSAKKISRYARNDGMVYIALCEIAENRKLSVKGARNDGVQGRFLAALEMTVWGNGFISRSVQRICLESAIPVSSS